MSSAPRYEDFAVGFALDPANPARYRVTVRAAPYPAPDGCFELPCPAGELPTRLIGLERQVRGSGAGRGVSAADTAASTWTPEEIGDRLFRALFRDDLRDSFLQSRERVRNKETTGLRLRLVIDPIAPGGSMLAALPWELLYRKETRTFLGRDLWNPVVRFLVTKEAPRPVQVEEKLRVLVIAANPSGSVHLNLDREAQRLEKAWATRGIAIRYLRSASPEELCEAVRRRVPHVLHFMGHGAFDYDTGEAGLVLRGQQGQARLAPASVLADAVRSAPTLRLVCLNACETARLPRRRGQDPFSGLAAALVMAGMPAVVAMQFPISDGAALTFSRAFYGALSAGDPVDAAVTEARRAIHTQDAHSWEWATPALYLSVATGELFARADESLPVPEHHRAHPAADGEVKTAEPGPQSRKTTTITGCDTVALTEGNFTAGTVNIGASSTRD